MGAEGLDKISAEIIDAIVALNADGGGWYAPNWWSTPSKPLTIQGRDYEYMGETEVEHNFREDHDSLGQEVMGLTYLLASPSKSE